MAFIHITNVVVLILCLTAQSANGEEESTIKSTDVRFLGYRQDNSCEELNLESLESSVVRPGTQTFIVIDGFFSNSTTPMSQSVTKELRKLPNCNVILVDWAPLSGALIYNASMTDSEVIQLYKNVTTYMRLIGKKVINLIEALKIRTNIKFSQVHIIGHSLGAQIAAVAGLEVLKSHNEKLARISALDPAGPQFQEKSVTVENRIDSIDAEFVDVYFTNREKLGNKLINIGHANFYINGGKDQPICKNETGLVMHAMCNHAFSYEFWNLAMRNDIRACPCELVLQENKCDCKDCKHVSCKNPVDTGLRVPITTRGNYYVSTSEISEAEPDA